MRYHSINKNVEIALNKTWVTVGIPFFLIFILSNIAGFYIYSETRIKYLPPVIVFGSILIAGIIGIIQSNKWFAYHLHLVEDPCELFQKAVRYQMILKSQAIRIAERNQIDISTRVKRPYENLPEIIIQDKLKLTNEFAEVENIKVYWKDIENFKILQFSSHINILLTGYDKKTYNLRLKRIKQNNIEFEIDKYLENFKNKNI